MPGQETDHPNERNQGKESAGHQPDRAPQKLDEREATGTRGSGESGKHSTGDGSKRSAHEEVERAGG